MNTLLLVVEQVFTISGRLTILTPDLIPDIVPEQTLKQSPLNVTLKFPDGSSLVAEAAFHIPHHNFANIEDTIKHLKQKPRYVCGLKNVEKSQIPIGTEVWLNSD